MRNIIFLVIFAIPNIVLADIPESNENPPDKVVMEHNGMPGFWFSRNTILNMLSSLRELPLRMQQISLLEEQLIINARQIQQLESIADNEQEAADTLRDELEAARTTMQKENPWYKSPFLWFTIGSLVTVVVSVAAIFALSALSP